MTKIKIGYWRQNEKNFPPVNFQNISDKLKKEVFSRGNLTEDLQQKMFENVLKKVSQEKDDKCLLPWPIKWEGDTTLKSKVVEFLKKGKTECAWMGWSTCRICGKHNGSVCLINKHFVYPEGYVHYIEDHDIMPDIQLLEYLKSI